jgi:Glycosyltransferase Family 4
MPSDADPVLYQPKPSSVLMVSEALARGGAERQMFALTHGLLQRGYEVQVFELLGTSAGQASFTDEFLKLGVRVRHPREFAAAGNADDRIILTRIESFAAILSAELPFLCRALTQAVKEIRPDIVHCWSDRSNLIGGFVSVGLQVPRIVFGNRVLPPPFWLESPVADVYRDAYRAFVVEPIIVCVSNSSVSIAEFERWLQYPRTPVALVYNGFLPSCMDIPNRSEMEAYRKAFGLPANATVVGAIMRLAPRRTRPCGSKRPRKSRGPGRTCIFFLRAMVMMPWPTSFARRALRWDLIRGSLCLAPSPKSAKSTAPWMSS